MYTNIITENKTFGVEIETSGGNLGSLSHYLNANCVCDGSIAGEYITGPLFETQVSLNYVNFIRIV